MDCNLEDMLDHGKLENLNTFENIIYLHSMEQEVIDDTLIAERIRKMLWKYVVLSILAEEGGM